MRAWSVLAATLLLSSCASAPPIPPELQYTPPVGDASLLATIGGNIVDSKVPLFDNENSYTYAIDGKRVMSRKKDWGLPIPVLPGDRTITAGFEQGVYMAYAKVDATLVAGHAYQVHSSCNTRGLGAKFSHCDFWIVDSATGKAISEIARGAIGGRPPVVLLLPR
ncbi:hypothetical protein [Luteimonas sp. MC1828]|uniref:hypothetical protein n=1 Tax=Luteimonas sp. MC1828 TaxID=2799787 RepID=UPI0018F1C2E5|nr:hypothetical protein [Luteimonas sp. MC1828]MBJ7576258.1 hypothetical protein [Luteimonas sp. MC1828]